MLQQDTYGETNYIDVPPHQAAARRPDVRCALIQAIDTPGPRRRHRRRLRRTSPTARSRPARRATSTTTALPSTTPKRRPRRSTAYEAANGPVTHQLLDDADRHDRRRRPSTCRAAWGAIGVDVTIRPDRAVEADQQRPVRRRRTSRPSAGATTPASSSTSRTSGGTASAATPHEVATALAPELRPPQRPGDRRPARPGPLARPTRRTAKALAEEINRRVRQAVLDHRRPYWTTVGHRHEARGAEHRPRHRCPTARASLARRRRLPRPGLA